MGTVDTTNVGKAENHGVQSRVAAKCHKPLYTQFRAQRKRLALTNQRLASKAEVALTTVARELGVEPGKPMSLPLAQRLGDTLGFDPAHVALVHARDVAHAQERSRKVSERVKLRFRRIRKHLDGYIRQQSPFTLRGSTRRLALTFERCRRKISIAELARYAREKTGVSQAHLSRYERGLSTADDETLALWARSLSELAPADGPVTLPQLDCLSQSLALAHHVNDTIEWRRHDALLSAGHRIMCPASPEYELEVGTSTTRLDPLEVKLVRSRQPARDKAGRSPIRIISARSRGIQLGILVYGEAELTLSHTPFPPESEWGIPSYHPGEEGVFHKRKCYQGDAVILSGEVFRRIEMQSATCLMAIISIRGNILIGAQ